MAFKKYTFAYKPFHHCRLPGLVNIRNKRFIVDIGYVLPLQSCTYCSEWCQQSRRRATDHLAPVRYIQGDFCSRHKNIVD